jgi:hypothetical protein
LRGLENPDIPEDVWQGFEEYEDSKGIEMTDEHFWPSPVSAPIATKPSAAACRAACSRRLSEFSKWACSPEADRHRARDVK